MSALKKVQITAKKGFTKYGNLKNLKFILDQTKPMIFNGINLRKNKGKLALI